MGLPVYIPIRSFVFGWALIGAPPPRIFERQNRPGKIGLIPWDAEFFSIIWKITHLYFVLYL